jgi:putative mRNA 3-end processing factor
MAPRAGTGFQESFSMLENTEAGLYCRAGDFYIDPSRPVGRAVITHAHADHARLSCGSYLATPPCAALLKTRLGSDVKVQELSYGLPLDVNGIRLSLHPAGHILGSAQVRLERNGEVWVVTGDFKRHPDPTCAPFEPLRCHTLVTESTFGLPVFHWPAPEDVFAEIKSWWRQNKEQGIASVLFAYALGKAQRILAGVDASVGPIFTHGAVEHMAHVYRDAGIRLPPTPNVADAQEKDDWAAALVVAPPSAEGSSWMRRFGHASRAFASGWMQIRGNRRRRALDRGFVLSDHADWQGLLDTIWASGAERVWVAHGFAAEMVQFLSEKGLCAEAVQAVSSRETEDSAI